MTNFIYLSPNFPANHWNFCNKLKENGIWARADVYPGNTHAFDLLRPWRDESKRARERCMEAFEYAQGHFMTPREEDV